MNISRFSMFPTNPTPNWIITYVQKKLIINFPRLSDDVRGTFLYIAPYRAISEARDVPVISFW